MPCTLDVLLQEHAAAAEVLRGKAFDAEQCRRQIRGLADQTHADPAAAGRTLEHQGIADTRGLAFGVGERREQPAARQQRHVVARGQCACEVLETEVAHLDGCRTHEYDAGRRAGRRELAVLAQESIAGMNGLGARRARGGENRVLTQIAFGGRLRPQTHGLVGVEDMLRMPVGIGVNGDRADPEALERAQHAHGDLTAIGDENLTEHPRPRSGLRAASGCRRCRGC